MEERYKSGTVLVGIKGENFVIIAADQQGSLPTYKTRKKKIYHIINNIYAGMAGHVAAAEYLIKTLRYEMRLFEYETKKKAGFKNVVNVLSEILFFTNVTSYFPTLISAFVIGGVDEEGPHVGVVDFDGYVGETNYCAEGSGMLYAYGVLDSEYRKDISLEDAKKLAVKAVLAATRRDPSCGWGPDVVVIDKEGGRFLSEEEIKKIVEEVWKEIPRERTTLL